MDDREMDQRLNGIESMLYQVAVRVGAIEAEKEKEVPKETKVKPVEKEPVFTVED